LAPEGIHYGRATALQARRAETLDLAYRRNPERFVPAPPAADLLPETVWINPPKAVPTTSTWLSNSYALVSRSR
jgi:hypothetical protein